MRPRPFGDLPRLQEERGSCALWDLLTAGRSTPRQRLAWRCSSVWRQADAPAGRSALGAKVKRPEQGMTAPAVPVLTKWPKRERLTARVCGAACRQAPTCRFRAGSGWRAREPHHTPVYRGIRRKDPVLCWVFDLQFPEKTEECYTHSRSRVLEHTK